MTAIKDAFAFSLVWNRTEYFLSNESGEKLLQFLVVVQFEKWIAGSVLIFVALSEIV